MQLVNPYEETVVFGKAYPVAWPPPGATRIRALVPTGSHVGHANALHIAHGKGSHGGPATKLERYSKAAGFLMRGPLREGQSRLGATLAQRTSGQRSTLRSAGNATARRGREAGERGAQRSRNTSTAAGMQYRAVPQGVRRGAGYGLSSSAAVYAGGSASGRRNQSVTASKAAGLLMRGPMLEGQSRLAASVGIHTATPRSAGVAGLRRAQELGDRGLQRGRNTGTAAGMQYRAVPQGARRGAGYAAGAGGAAYAGGTIAGNRQAGTLNSNNPTGPARGRRL